MYPTIIQARKALINREVTARKLVEYYLNECEKHKDLNAFLEIFSEEALNNADLLDNKISEGKQVGKLAGLVMGLKDNICFKNHTVSASSKILVNFVSIFNATATDRLLAEDAIILGRLNCDEFAMGGSNENSAFGPVPNPHDKTKVTGGSSGGSAAAVASGMCHAALGSDTGGSIRQPASFCGLVGLKPTYGRVSRHGLIAYASSFDQIGPLTRNVEDAALLLEVIAGHDDFDSTASEQPVPGYSNLLTLNNKLKVAYLRDPLEHALLDHEVKDTMLQIIDSISSDGHKTEGVEFPFLDYIVPTYYVLTTAEASSNLARYDGIHYGYRSPDAINVDATYIKSRSDGFGEEVKRRIMTGTFVLSAGYYDAYYAKAQKVRRLIQEKTFEILKDHDFILLPTTPSPAFPLGKLMDDPIEMYLQDIFTVHASMAGIPAISIPLGRHSSGLPFGVQIYARKFDEANMFAFAKYLMQFSRFKSHQN